MPQAQYGASLSVGGVSIQKTINRQGDHPNPYEVTLQPGKAGTLTTRTDTNTGEATLGASHGITDAMVVDVYWAGGVRYGMTVGTVAGNVVPLDGGAGDDLPIATTALVVCQQVTINTHIDGDAIVIIGLCAEVADNAATSQVHLLFEDTAGDDIAALSLVANSPQIYDVEGGASNPFAGDPIASCKASNGNATYSAVLKIGSLEDSTP